MQALIQANLPLSPHNYKVLTMSAYTSKLSLCPTSPATTGMHLWAECLSMAPPLPNKLQYYHPNHSTLQWPQHATPSPANGRLWNWTLCKLFSVPNTAKLMLPLGKWTKHYHTDYRWNWTICPTTYNQYHWQDQVWMHYKPTTLQWTYIWYQDQLESTTNPLACLPSATLELTTQGIQIALSITPIQQQVMPAPTYPEPLICQITTPTPGQAVCGTALDPMQTSMHYKKPYGKDVQWLLPAMPW